MYIIFYLCILSLYSVQGESLPAYSQSNSVLVSESKNKDKVDSVQRNIEKPKGQEDHYLIDDGETFSINAEFLLEELNLCDILLFSTFSKASKGGDYSGTSLVVSEILIDETNSIKPGDNLSPYSFQVIREHTDSGVMYCRRFKQNFLYFISKEEYLQTIDGQVSVNEIRDFLMANSKGSSHSNKNKGQNIFKIKKPYYMNRSFFIEEINSCEVLLTSSFSENSDKIVLSVLEIIRDGTNSLSIGDTLATIPFREMLDSEYTGALFCRRHDKDFLNFFSSNNLTEPDNISIDDIKNN